MLRIRFSALLLLLLFGSTACSIMQPSAGPAYPTDGAEKPPAQETMILSPISPPPAPTPTHSLHFTATPTYSYNIQDQEASPGEQATSAPPDESDKFDPTSPGSIEELAIADLAKRLNIAPEKIKALSVTPDEFNGRNFGCPIQGKPSSKGQPVIRSGVEIVLLAGDNLYHYRGKRNYVIYCFVEKP